MPVRFSELAFYLSKLVRDDILLCAFSIQDFCFVLPLKHISFKLINTCLWKNFENANIAKSKSIKPISQ